MTEAHIEADRICAERLDYARARLWEWRTEASSLLYRAMLDAGEDEGAAYRAAMAESSRCFQVYLQVEADILAERRRIVRVLDEQLYSAS